MLLERIIINHIECFIIYKCVFMKDDSSGGKQFIKGFSGLGALLNREVDFAHTKLTNSDENDDINIDIDSFDLGDYE